MLMIMMPSPGPGHILIPSPSFSWWAELGLVAHAVAQTVAREAICSLLRPMEFIQPAFVYLHMCATNTASGDHTSIYTLPYLSMKPWWNRSRAPT